MKYESIKLKYLADIFNGNSIPDDLKSEYEGKEIPYIPTKELNVEDSTINYNNGLSVNREDGFKIAPTNSVLMCIEGGSAGRKIALTDREVAFVNKLCCISGVKVDSRYLFHALRSKDFTEQFFLNMTGLIGGVSINVLKNLYVSHPSNKETQRKLISILDQKCGKIDELIANQQGQIEKLKEYKQSVITEAVTKGLDKSAPLKDSGIEWIGKIPADWQSIRLKYCTYIRARLGWKGLKAEEYVDEGYPLLSAFNIINDRLDTSEVNFINQFRYDESPEIKLSINDILLVKDGAGIGKCAIVEELIYPSTTNGSLAVITTNNGLLAKYLYYYFLSKMFQKYIDRLKAGMGVPHLFQSDLREIEIPFSTIEEQEKIISYLDNKCGQIDSLIAIKQEKIEKLQEYKKSLIYEYVTGKKEVV